jgi:hypothetical protein
MADKENTHGGGDKGGDQKGGGSEQRGHVPIEKGWQPGVQGGYQPTTSETGTPPTGGGGGKEPEKGSGKD